MIEAPKSEIVLAITGGIAAYKAVEILRLLQKKNIAVTVVMTENATKFITPLTFEALSGKPVITSMFDGSLTDPIMHITLTSRVDAVLIAPATANIIAKITYGLADDFLSTFLLACTCPIFIAPAMNSAMYAHPVVQHNLTQLKSRGYQIITPAAGELACKTTGVGRLEEPAVIVDYVYRELYIQKDMKDIHVLVTAGPTREYIDAVRYISNPSSGKMGYALAMAARDRGAHVSLVSGPTSLQTPSGVTFIRVESAHEMYEAVMSATDAMDVIIMSAAVGDYHVTEKTTHKIKKESNEQLSLNLQPTTDILLNIGNRKRNNQILVGFAAETQEHLANARKKLKQKNLDLIVVNDVSRKDSGFAVDANEATILDVDGSEQALPLLPKEELAHKILDAIRRKFTTHGLLSTLS